MSIKEFIRERIEENKHLFTQEELKSAKENEELIKKIYLLGGINGTNAMLGGAN